MKSLAAALLVSSVGAATAAFAAYDGLDYALGRALFERDWVTSNASTESADGLGPLFNARSCAGCHTGEAFAARFTEAADGKVAGRGLVVRFADSEGRADPTYGAQLQIQAVAGMEAEGRVVLAAQGAEGLDVSFDLAGGLLSEETRTSIRIAPPLAGRGGLERIAEEAILANADPDDLDGDGISGRANFVVRDGVERLGRFGWKARNPDLQSQIADAFAIDIGLSSALTPSPHGDCTSAQADCLAAPTGESEEFSGHELSDEMIALVHAFVANIPPSRPASDGGDVAGGLGSGLFAATGCAACHVPELADASGAPVTAYADLLLHDLGQALDDGMGEPGVASAEWRTPPLIALGAPWRRFLHDGSASTIDSAIRAHGGEAAAARSRYEALSEDERTALLDFLSTL